MTDDYLPNIYASREWFESLAWQHRWINFMVGWWVGEFGVPESVLDFGCGDGWWLQAFHDAGSKTVCGVELHEVAKEFIPTCAQAFTHDLREPVNLAKKADLVICLEVAEHLRRADADTLCQTLALHTFTTLLFSAATPDQKGTGHINLQTQEYWVKRLEARNLKFSAMYTGKVRAAFKNIVNECFEFLPKNVMVFKAV